MFTILGKRWNLQRCLFAVLILALLPLLQPAWNLLPVMAKSDAALSFSHCHSQAQIDLYHVASGSQEEGYAVQERFVPANPSFVLDDVTSLRETEKALHSYISGNHLEPDLSCRMDENGLAFLDGLDTGLYLVTSAVYTHEDTDYLINPTLVRAEEGDNPLVALKPVLLEEFSFELRINVIKLISIETGSCS